MFSITHVTLANCVAHWGNTSRPNIAKPQVFIAMLVIKTQMMFIAKPVDAISFVDMLEAAYTIAFGAVATGSIKAYEHVTTDESTEMKLEIEIVNVYPTLLRKGRDYFKIDK